MNNKQFWLYQLKAALPLLIGYLLFLALLWLLAKLYYLPTSYLIDTIRFSLPFVIIWETLECYRSFKRVQALQKGRSILPTNPTEKQLLANYQVQAKTTQYELRQLHNQQQEQLDHVELYSHEIKNSLTSLQAAAENKTTVPSTTILAAVRQANDQLNMLLNDERLAITGNDFNFEWIKLDTLVNDILKENSAIFIHQQLLPQLENLANVQVLTDRKWLRFCIYQLLSNAIKYSPQGTTITISWQNNQLQIADQGCGISQSDLPRIYENGFSGHNGHQTIKSTGMGLYLVKKVTDQLNFGLNIQSEVGNGTTACLLFTPQNVRLS